MECISRETNKVMLLRLPDSLYDLLKSTPDKVDSLFFDPVKKDLAIVVNDPAGAGSATKRFSCKVDHSDDDLHIFSVDGARKAMLKAKVAFRGNLLPEKHNILDVKALEQLKQVGEYEIQTQTNEDTSIQKRVFALHPDHKSFVMTNTEQAVQATLRKKYKEKRVRGEPEKVKKMLFELFDHQRYWKTKALADETSQPESFLNEILQELGDKVPSGQFRGHWQLKAQYRSEEDHGEPDLVKKPRLV
jgi:hypothetical protein